MKNEKNENLTAFEEETLGTQEETKDEEIVEQMQEGEKAEQAAEENDLKCEMIALLERYPELHERLKNGESMPQEVLMTCAKDGVSLQVAYAEYEMRKAQAQVEQLRRENEILRKNMTATSKAPVKGATLGGSASAKSRDPFLDGLLGDE